LQRDDVAVIVCLSITSATTAAEIVRYTGRPKNSISRSVMGLEEAGLLTRSSHPEDGRAAGLALTAQGRRIFKQISGRFAEHDKRLIAGMNEHERREFTRLLNIVSDSSASWD
jgi:DNA-binding MarR family transcriptional regulator